jgi:hypothetical protein
VGFAGAGASFDASFAASAVGAPVVVLAALVDGVCGAALVSLAAAAALAVVSVLAALSVFCVFSPFAEHEPAEQEA